MSSAIVFPSGLPYPMVDGYTVSEVDITVPVQWEQGERRRRQKYRSTPQLLSLSWVFSREQMQSFDNWFENTLLSGEKEFDIQIAGKGVVYEWYTAVFAEPYEADFQQGNFSWQVNAQLILVRRLGVNRTVDSLHSIHAPMAFTGYAKLTHGNVTLRARNTMPFSSYARLRHIESPTAQGVIFTRNVTFAPGFVQIITTFDITVVASFTAGSASGTGGGSGGTVTLTASASFITGTASGGVGAARYTGKRHKLIALENAQRRVRGT